MALVRREAPYPWKVLSRWAGERPADPGQDPPGHRPAAAAPPAAVLGPPRRGAAVADARRQPGHAAAYLRRVRRLPSRAPPAVGARGAGPRQHPAPSRLRALD